VLLLRHHRRPSVAAKLLGRRDQSNDSEDVGRAGYHFAKPLAVGDAVKLLLTGQKPSAMLSPPQTRTHS
jgi:hypothetical protein